MTDGRAAANDAIAAMKVGQEHTPYRIDLLTEQASRVGDLDSDTDLAIALDRH